MGALQQQTLNASVEFSGVGLHTGEDCRIVIRPARENAGVVFVLCDKNNPEQKIKIPAAPEHVARACHGTMLAFGGGEVSTVEHVMAALAICAVDNAEIDVYGGEAPILDGSAAPFVNGINAVGLKRQRPMRDAIIIDEPISVVDGDRSIEMTPSDAFRLDVTIDFENCVIGKQRQSVCLDDPSVLDRMAKSRTFCRLHEVEALRAMDLIRGGSLENSIVVDGASVLNEDKLRDPYEFVLHKALDLVGDLYLLGAPVRGAITAVKPGHDLNTRMAKALSARYLRDNDAAPAVLAATA